MVVCTGSLNRFVYYFGLCVHNSANTESSMKSITRSDERILSSDIFDRDARMRRARPWQPR